jgi:uroporphyrinogen-III synthase
MPDARALVAKRIVVTRAAAQAAPLLDKLRAQGAIPVATPAIQILPPDDAAPLRDAAAALATFGWIVFTSANGVRALFNAGSAARDASTPWPEGPRVAAVGNATARALLDAGVRVDFQPSAALADSLGRELPLEAGTTVLWPRGDIAGPELATTLAARGGIVTDVVAYRTVADVGLLGIVDALRDRRVDAITFSSASTVRHVVEGLAAAGVRIDRLPAATRPLIVCIGPVTAAAARECSLPVDGIAEPSDDDGLIAALVRSFANRTAPA